VLVRNPPDSPSLATAVRVAVALAAAAFIAILDYYRQAPEVGAPVWLDSTAEGVLVIALIGAAGAVVGHCPSHRSRRWRSEGSRDDDGGRNTKKRAFASKKSRLRRP